MQAKDELLEKMGETYGYINILMDRKVEQYKLSAAEKSATTMSGLVTVVVLVLIGMQASLFGLIALAFYLAGARDYGNGFGIIALIMLALLLVIFLLRRILIVNPVVRMVISVFFSDKNSPEQ